MKKILFPLILLSSILFKAYSQGSNQNSTVVSGAIVKSTTTEKDKRNIEAVRKMYAGEDKELSMIAKDVVWHVPGHNPVSGDYKGYDEYTKLLPEKMAPLTKWKFKIEDIMVNGDYVVATVILDAERKGKKLNMKGAHVMKLNEEGKIVEGWGFMNQQDLLDDFFTD